MLFNLTHEFAERLPFLCAPVERPEFPAPRLLLFNEVLADELGLPGALDSPEGARLLCGMDAPDSAVAQAYAGHQFGNFVPQLGDGRAMLLGELRDGEGRLRDLHLKGSGATVFSRGGDGRAALGPMLREYLVSEAMHALGVPTTRSLAVVATGEAVRREGLKPGAVLARVAASHLRVGTFEFVRAHGSVEDMRRLADYAIERHDPDLLEAPDRYLRFLDRVIERQTALVTQWMLLGFVHGVMNTDNMTISGETIDYGPCAFMEAYDPATVFSSIDARGRYAYGNQPAILQWNLARLAECLLPLIDDDLERAVQVATGRIEAIPAAQGARWLEGMCRKLGLAEVRPGDARLVRDLLGLMQADRVDFTRGFRLLVLAADGEASPFRSLFVNGPGIDEWFERWWTRLAADGRSAGERVEDMRLASPACIPRNHLVEEALTAAEARNDLGPLQRMIEDLAEPWADRPGRERYLEPAPETFGPYVTFCGT